MTSPNSTPSRFRPHTCSRCRASVGADAPPVTTLSGATYAPMVDGPEWEAIGDWTAPRGLGITLCAACVDALAEFVFGVVIPL